MKQVSFKLPLRMFALLCGLLLSASAFAQQITVNGHVKDATGEDIIGATVRVQGQSGGVITDFDGNFQIQANKGAKLEIAYIGYETAIVDAAPTVEVLLKEEAAKSLNEVVVIGYGVAKKNDLTGSVTAIKPDEKNHGMQTSAQDMIQGKIAGVNVNSASGAPGEGAQIRIRGGASLNASNDPLIVIDGMAMDNNSTKGVSNPLSMVNPNDIETFTVLKDASATAIYGSRGSNGVIIITTKKGRKGQGVKVSYNGNVSVSTTAKRLDVMDGDEYRAFIKNYYQGKDNYDDIVAGLGTANTDWQKEIYRAGVSTDHNVTVSGSVNKDKWSLPYRVSVGYTSQNGVLKGSSFNRFTGGFSLSPSLLEDHLTLNINGKYMYAKTDPSNTGAIGAATTMDPTRPITSTEEQYKGFGGYWEWVTPTSAYDSTFPYQRNADAPCNPVELLNQYSYSKAANTFLGNFEADYKIHGFEDLRLHVNLAGELAKGHEDTDYSNLRNSVSGFYYGSQSYNHETKYNMTLSAYAQYYKDFNENHHFDVMAGYEWSHFKYWGDSWAYGTYPSTNTGTDDSGKPLAGQKHGESTSEWKSENYLVSWYGRANYTLMNRYLLTATVRYDGSSRFAKGHKWGVFPSAAFAWRVKDEAFLADVDAVSDLKFRLGWGKTGQQDLGMDYYYLPTYKVSTNNHYYYPVGGGSNTGVLNKPQPYNDQLTWETTTTYNIGLDYGMFNQRLTLNFDAYYRKTTDLLNYSSVPTGSNFDNKIYNNVGSLSNKGVEIAITGKPIVTNDWFWEVSVNAGYNHNEITSLYGTRDMVEASMQVGSNEQITYHAIGKPSNSFYVYQQVYDANGNPIMGVYVDRNGDGVVDSNDKYFYKSINAPWTGGFSTKVTYKNWDFGTNFRLSLGNYVYNGIESGKVNTSVLYNSKGYYSNTTADIASLGWTSYNFALSDYFVQNASFLKCDNITLGYSFENLFKGAKYAGINGRIYFSCSNVFTVTKYKGLDPEQTSGYEGSVYPRSRTFLLGVNLNF